MNRPITNAKSNAPVPLNRRDFLKATASLAAGAGTGLLAAGCSRRLPQKNKVTLAVTGYALDAHRKLIDELGFTKKTGIEVELLQRPVGYREVVTMMTGAMRAGTTPYDVMDFCDIICTMFSRAGWLVPLDDVLDDDVWNDFLPPLKEMTGIWDRYKGQTFRIHHNFELCYWWYRKDWFEKRGIDVPRTWDDVKMMGREFTDTDAGIWATEEGLQKNSYLEVYTAWITCQAGGNLYDVDESFRTALEYIYELMYEHKVLNPACLQKNYDQQNNDYIGDRVAFMRQWPFFFDVARQHASWYSPEKVTCHLPPVGPGGKSVSTYAAGWGYGILKNCQNLDAAKELVRFLTSTENAAKMVDYSSWFLNARRSVLDAAGDRGLAKFLKMYTDAGVIAPRPYHPKYAEAIAVLEDVTSAFLTRQLSIDKALAAAREKMAKL